MNRKEIEEYINEAMTLKLDIIKQELKEDWQNKYKNHFNSFPKKLYKYVTLKDYYFDSIINNYIYLCPAEKLDDQFECRVDFSKEILLDNKHEVNKKFVNAVINRISKYPSNFDKKQMKIFTMDCLDRDNKLDLDKVSLKLDEIGDNITDEQHVELLKIFAALISGMWIGDSGKRTIEKMIEDAHKEHEKKGIGSLTENNKSQVMWEMYGNHYQGVCIEYDFTNDIDAMVNIFPVIYGDKRKTDFLFILANICLDYFMASVSHSKIGNFDSVKDYIRLFLTKYNEWSFQKEWRIVGDAGQKFPVAKIKRIYLGKRISDEDKNKIIKIAKEKNIELYIQSDNFDSLKLEYKKMELE